MQERRKQKKVRRYRKQTAEEVEEDEIREQLICDIAELFEPDYDPEAAISTVRKELMVNQGRILSDFRTFSS